MMKSSVRVERSLNYREHVLPLHHVNIDGSHRNGLNVQLLVEKAFKVEQLFVDNMKMMSLKKSKRVIARLMRNLKMSANVMDLKNVQLNGLVVHGQIVQRNVEVEVDHVK